MSLDQYIDEIKYSGTTVSRIKLRWGLQARPFWNKLSRLTPQLAVMWAGRFSSEESLSAEWLLAHTFEKAFSVEVPSRGQYLRAVLIELQRANWAFRFHARVFHCLGDLYRYETAMNGSEKITNLLELFSGSRVLHQMIQIGGVKKDLSIGEMEKIEQTLSELERIDEKIFSMLYHDLVLIERLKSNFIIDEEFFEEVGVSGPIAQASGLSWDIRKLKPYEPYDHVRVSTYEPDPFELKKRSVGRHWDRLMSVRFQNRQSIEIVRKLLKGIPEGSFCNKVDVGRTIPESDHSSVIEAPSGALHCVIANGQICFSSVSMRLAPHLENLLHGCDCEDLKLAFYTLGFDFSQGDLV